jgi:DNA-binding NarL/FixJ family response regulator
MVTALVLDHDPWRYRGIGSVLHDSGKVRVLEGSDFARILTLESAPSDLRPDVILLSHGLIIDYGISLIPHLKDLFGSVVLVYGDQANLDNMAQLLAAGASGYFVLSTPPGYVSDAVLVVNKGKLWGPREAVALMAQRVTERKAAQSWPEVVNALTENEMTILRYLNDGLTNKEIASRLGVAEVTVKARLTKLYKRFGVTTRLQLLSTVIRKRLLDSSESEPESPTK